MEYTLYRERGGQFHNLPIAQSHDAQEIIRAYEAEIEKMKKGATRTHEDRWQDEGLENLCWRFSAHYDRSEPWERTVMIYIESRDF